VPASTRSLWAPSAGRPEATDHRPIGPLSFHPSCTGVGSSRAGANRQLRLSGVTDRAAYVKCIAHALPRPMVAVPLAPGTLKTEMNPDEPVPTPEEWAVDAVPFILQLHNAARSELSGASLSVPGYYSKTYVDSFIIRDGQPLLAEPQGAARFARPSTAGGVDAVGPVALAAGATVVAAVVALAAFKRRR
jgi:hypothetical protein